MRNILDINLSKILGFTLAEVLITLGITGVIAALTIPSLMTNIQDRQLKTAWKKQYSIISQAYERVKQDEGGDLTYYFNVNDPTLNRPREFIDKLGSYLHTVMTCSSWNVCGTSPAVDLSTNNVYKNLSGSYVDWHDLVANSPQYLLKDGANLYGRGYNPGYGVIFIDVNGFAKKPNLLGKDLFCALLTKDKVLPCGAPGTGLEDTCNSNTSVNCDYVYGFSGQSVNCAGAGCSAEYLYND